MRKIYQVYHLLIVMVVITFLSSCADKEVPVIDNPSLPKDSTEIGLRAIIATSVPRLANTGVSNGMQWTNTDSIGLFVKIDDILLSGGYGLYPSSLSQDKKSAGFTGPFYWQKLSTQHQFFAYYPKISGIDDPLNIPVSVPAVQTQAGTSADQLNKSNILVAFPTFVTSPVAPDASLNNDVELNFVSALSAIEFRFASCNKPGLLINSITLVSDNGDFVAQNGSLDLTNADFDVNFAKISGGQRSSSVTLNIQNPVEVPVTNKKTIITGDDATKPANTDIVFPARLLVLPNFYTALKDPSKQETWTVTLETNEGEFSKTLTGRTLKPGEMQVIQYVVPTDTTNIEGGDDPELQDPGAPWDGVVTPPPASSIDNVNKIITINRPGELAWVSEIVNLKRALELVTDTFFNGYTLKLAQNINLNNQEWTPIGANYEGHGRFTGTLDGTTDDGLYSYVISGLKISAPHNTAGYTGSYIGLFGVASPVMIKNIYIKDATINIPSIDANNLAYVGGLIGWVPAAGPSTQLVNCKFAGKISVNTGTRSCPVGGICGGMDVGSITGCSSTAVMSATTSLTYSSTSNMGGIVGTTGRPVKACLFSGSITGMGSWNVGGITGYQNGSSIVASKNEGSITSNGSQAQIGGIAGSSMGDIISCYNTGVINELGVASQYDNLGVGGIAGTFYMGGSLAPGKTLKGCYTTTSPQKPISYNNRAGNIVGYWSPLFGLAFTFDLINNNYYKGIVMTSDITSGMGTGRVTRFTANAWPSTSMDGWGTGDGSADNTYWNTDFPTGYGDVYPMLYWETVE